MMIVQGGWNTPVVSDNYVGFSDGKTLVRGSASDWSLLRSYRELDGCVCRSHGEKSGWGRFLDGDHGGESLGDGIERVGALSKGGFLENLVQAFVNVSETTENFDRSLAFSSVGGSDAWRRDELRFSRDGSWGPRRASFFSNEEGAFLRSNLSQLNVKFRVHRMGERLQDDTGATQRSSVFLSPDERSWPSDFLPAKPGRTGQGASETWPEGVQEDRLLREARHRSGEGNTLNSDGDEWKSLSRAITAGQTFSNHQLMKMAELRLSGDMREGDAGGQVSLLQRALFWLGYLAQGSYTTGYFGIETKRALQEFQEVHGVCGSGLWNSLSKQALWHKVSGEILRRVGEERAALRCGKPVIHPSQAYKSSEAEVQTARGNSGTIAGVISSPIPVRKLLFGKVGIVVLIAGAVLVIIKLISFMERVPQRQSVKRRILRSQWYGDPDTQMRTRRLFQKGRPEFNRYRTLDMDIDKKILGFPSYASPVSKAKHDRSGQWLNQPAFYGQRHGGSLEVDPEVQYRQEHAVSHFTPKKKSLSVSPWDFNEKVASVSEIGGPDKSDGWQAAERKLTGIVGSHGSGVGERHSVLPLNKKLSVKQEPSARVSPFKRSIMGENSKRRGTTYVKVPDIKGELEPRTLRLDNFSGMTSAHSKWQEEDELELDRRIKEMRNTVQAAEQNRRTAMLALAEERQRSLELEVKINRQREAAAALEEEVRVLKESHDALLASLRKKYSSSAAARAAAALLYQDWDSNVGDSAEEAAS